MPHHSDCHELLDKIVHRANQMTPVIVGLTGAMAVGKTTFARNLKEALSLRIPDRKIQTISTDGFLYPNLELQNRGIMGLKGFPETFQNTLYLDFLARLRENQHNLFSIPQYSQQKKDIDMDTMTYIPASDIYILEGINLLFPLAEDSSFSLFDWYDELVILEMDPADIVTQAFERFDWALKEAHISPTEYFTPLLKASAEEIQALKEDLYKTIHEPFWHTYIEPYLDKASMRIVLQHTKPFDGVLPYFA